MVEASILFPIILMIFMGMIILALYLPQRAILQYATQHAATAVATTVSDNWIEYSNVDSGSGYSRSTGNGFMDNVYVALFLSFFSGSQEALGQNITVFQDDKSIKFFDPNLTVECELSSVIIYKEVSVTATSTLITPVDLSFVGFPTEIPIVVTSTAVVQNGDEFIRNMDISKDLVVLFADKYNIDTSGLMKYITQARNYLNV